MQHRPLLQRSAAVATALLLLAGPAGAQEITLNLGQGAGLNERVIQLIGLITVLSVAPSILIMVTSFTRFVIAFSILRTGSGDFSPGALDRLKNAGIAEVNVTDVMTAAADGLDQRLKLLFGCGNDVVNGHGAARISRSSGFVSGCVGLRNDQARPSRKLASDRSVRAVSASR